MPKFNQKYFLTFVILGVIIYPQKMRAQDSGRDRSCVARAIQILREHNPRGYAVITQLKDPQETWRYIDCSSPDLGLGTLVHEGVHFLNGELSLDNDRRTYFYADGTSSPVDSSIIFRRNEILSLMSASERSRNYVETYVSNEEMQNGSIHMLLDELNAYTHGLRTSVETASVLPLPNPRSERDGLASLMFFTKLSLARIQAGHPEIWQRLRSNADYFEAIRRMWRLAESTLVDACKVANLGLHDTAILNSL